MTVVVANYGPESPNTATVLLLLLAILLKAVATYEISSFGSQQHTTHKIQHRAKITICLIRPIGYVRIGGILSSDGYGSKAKLKLYSRHVSFFRRSTKTTILYSIVWKSERNVKGAVRLP